MCNVNGDSQSPPNRTTACKIRKFVTTKWHKTWRRLSRMSWEEVRTRAGQEMSKRVDLIAYKAGYDFTRSSLPVTSMPGGKFFFDADEVPGRIALLQEFLPQEVGLILSEAD